MKIINFPSVFKIIVYTIVFVFAVSNIYSAFAAREEGPTGLPKYTQLLSELFFGKGVTTKTMEDIFNKPDYPRVLDAVKFSGHLWGDKYPLAAQADNAAKFAGHSWAYNDPHPHAVWADNLVGGGGGLTWVGVATPVLVSGRVRDGAFDHAKISYRCPQGVIIYAFGNPPNPGSGGSLPPEIGTPAYPVRGPNPLAYSVKSWLGKKSSENHYNYPSLSYTLNATFICGK